MWLRRQSFSLKPKTGYSVQAQKGIFKVPLDTYCSAIRSLFLKSSQPKPLGLSENILHFPFCRSPGCKYHTFSFLYSIIHFEYKYNDCIIWDCTRARVLSVNDLLELQYLIFPPAATTRPGSSPVIMERISLAPCFTNMMISSAWVSWPTMP